jgi:hypothetical protein
MPRFGPVKRADLVRYLREVGFEGALLRRPPPVQGER